ncbi:MAG: hypothetical protein A3J62_01875 [Candidatus Buchananbacteria bacterium RIFCSPHIGHO2_02_FULL_38_8]|uniref:Uncharacterized protein n=1 Tax=Candidatus Buchananbacteria bacterium RIFCSPHIGHO2_02_FULL_38_8 TaxID=1797538 RepID=A0A1G1Y4C6_9BACT|nr:hypothetical protein [uncultured bacterium]OGY47152.1 MAG: hypothetical protein A3J62_01875 [Candidatus Buchananbacteria bacterium RIFCSPHIGHO2_02_FULL_38_8]
MLETSKDLLFVVLAFCILWFTVFVCWGLYYMITMLRNASKMTASIREKLELVDKILKLVKDKLEKGSNHMALISDSVIKLVGFFMEKQKTGSGKNKKKKKK